MDEIKNNRFYNSTEKTPIQEIAECLGWERDKNILVNQLSVDIAPNGTRRLRRINNNYVVKDEDYDFYLRDILNRK